MKDLLNPHGIQGHSSILKGKKKLELIPNSFWNAKEMLTFSLDVSGSSQEPGEFG